MKINNKFIVALLTIGFALGACENLDLDLQQNPNQIAPEQGSLNEVYNSIQLNSAGFFLGAQGGAGAAARMYHAGGFTYRAFTTPNSFNGLWGTFYNEILPDVEGLSVIAGENDFGVHIATANILKAYAMITMVDVLGDVPYSEATQGTNIISPSVDSGADIYAAAITLLDEAIATLGSTTGPAPEIDIYYDGDKDKWVTAAKTIKLKAALNTGDVATINSIVSGGDIIDTPGEDFQFQAGTNRDNPNSRHPFYNNHYETADGDYLSNYYMWLLRADKTDPVSGSVVVDPRIRYYFYRKVDDAIAQDQTTYSCHFSTFPGSVANGDQPGKPSYFDTVDPRLPYCVAYDDGYSGRDHLNGEGIPPDGPIRTSYGLYPFGGDFDDDTFDDTRLEGTTGGLGGGIIPVLTSSFTHFMLAEAVVRLGATGNAATLLRTGIDQSLDKVESFESLVSTKMNTEIELRDGSTGTVKEIYGMDAASKDAYGDFVDAAYAAAANDNDRVAIIIKEFYIAAWGNGIEAYNMYRRTAMPANMPPALEANPGKFPLSFFYPANSETRNSNITQKSDLDVPVFWQDASVAASLY